MTGDGSVRYILGVPPGWSVAVDYELTVRRHCRKGGVCIIGICHTYSVYNQVVLVHIYRERADCKGPDAVFSFGERYVSTDSQYCGHCAREGYGLCFRGPEPEDDGMVVIYLWRIQIGAEGDQPLGVLLWVIAEVNVRLLGRCRQSNKQRNGRDNCLFVHNDIIYSLQFYKIVL